MRLLGDPGVAVLTAGFVLATLIAAGLGWACYRLLVDRGRLLLRLAATDEAESSQPGPGLPAGAFLSDFALPSLGGGIVTLSGLTDDPLLLVFVQPHCLFSRAVAHELRSLCPASDAPLPVLVVTGVVDAPDDLASFAGLPGPVLLDPSGQVARLARVGVTPAGYRVEARRTVGPPLRGPLALLAAARGEAVAELGAEPAAVSPLLPAPARPQPPPIGTIAPDFTLPLATGGEWSLRAHRGRPLTLVFSAPGCPPCARVLDVLGRREPSGIVLVSRGDAEDHRAFAAEGWAAPVLVQRGREVARAYGTLDTPAAFIIDAAGAVAAGPAIGADAVLALIAENDPHLMATGRVVAQQT
jgi:peroxiredoxin